MVYRMTADLCFLQQMAHEIDEGLRLWPDDFLVRNDCEDVARRELKLGEHVYEATGVQIVLNMKIVEHADARASEACLSKQFSVVGQKLELRTDRLPNAFAAEFPVRGQIRKAAGQTVMLRQVVGFLGSAAARDVIGRSAQGNAATSQSKMG